MWRPSGVALAEWLAAGFVACARPGAPPPARPAIAKAPMAAAETQAPPIEWPLALAPAMARHGAPHAQPISLPPDAQGRARWLAFVGPPGFALGAWEIAIGSDGTTPLPVQAWPSSVRVVGGVVEGGAAYVLLETVAGLDQPAGLRGVWVDAGAQGGRASPFDGCPLCLADAHDVDQLAERLQHPAPLGSPAHNAPALIATMRAAAASTGALARSLPTDGADLGVVWQSMFVQTTGRIDGQGAGGSASTDHALALVRDALGTQACGADTCETWGDTGRSIVRFGVEGGRWVLRGFYDDAPGPASVEVPRSGSAAPAPPVAPDRRQVAAASNGAATAEVLAARAREVTRVIGEAALADEKSGGGTIGVGLADLAPDAAIVVVREGSAAQVYVVDPVAPRRAAGDAAWDAAFADVDGDGRTDVVLRMTRPAAGAARGAVPSTWTQVFLAPPPTVQARALRADVASSLAVMDAPDAPTAARLAASIPTHAVTREDACRLLNTARTAAGFHRVATADARVLRFDEPGLPTWQPKVIPSSKVTDDDVRDLAVHCADMTCDASRPYCGWSGGTDSQDVWFAWQGGQLAIAGAADYSGE